jgi:hypothetical protein
MKPSIKPPWAPKAVTRWGFRAIDDFTAEELAQLQQKLEGWIRQRGPEAGTSRRRRPFVMKQRAPYPLF